MNRSRVMQVKVVSNFTYLLSFEHKVKNVDFSEHLVLLCTRVYLLGQLLAYVVLFCLAYMFYCILRCFYICSAERTSK